MMNGIENSYGTVTLLPPEVPVEEPTQTLLGTFRWTPGPELRGEVPETFAFELQCWRRFDGVRYFLPVVSAEITIEQGFVGGLAILNDQGNWNAHHRYSYRAMFLMMKQLRGLNLRRKRRFQTISDLLIRGGSRLNPEQASILSSLPEREGLSDSGEIPRLLQSGREAAIEAGVKSPSTAQAIEYGLLQAAQSMSSWKFPEDQIPRLIRCALFDESGLPEEPIDTETWQHLEQRVFTAIWRHLEDEVKTFESWFQGSQSSFVKQIAQQKTAPGGRMSKELVRKFLLEIGWKGYFYVGQCLEAMSRDFRLALQEPLTETEQRHFERLYSPQTAFGGLPFVLLWERIPNLSVAMVHYLNSEEDEQTRSTLLVLLMFYSQLADIRRVSDRLGQYNSRERKKWKSSPTSGS